MRYEIRFMSRFVINLDGVEIKSMTMSVLHKYFVEEVMSMLLHLSELIMIMIDHRKQVNRRGGTFTLIKVAKEQRLAKALEESNGVLSEKLRKTEEDSRTVRLRTKIHNEEKKEEHVGSSNQSNKIAKSSSNSRPSTAASMEAERDAFIKKIRELQKENDFYVAKLEVMRLLCQYPGIGNLPVVEAMKKVLKGSLSDDALALAKSEGTISEVYPQTDSLGTMQEVKTDLRKRKKVHIFDDELNELKSRTEELEKRCGFYFAQLKEIVQILGQPPDNESRPVVEALRKVLGANEDHERVIAEAEAMITQAYGQTKLKTGICRPEGISSSETAILGVQDPSYVMFAVESRVSYRRGRKTWFRDGALKVIRLKENCYLTACGSASQFKAVKKAMKKIRKRIPTNVDLYMQAAYVARSIDRILRRLNVHKLKPNERVDFVMITMTRRRCHLFDIAMRGGDRCYVPRPFTGRFLERGSGSGRLEEYRLKHPKGEMSYFEAIEHCLDGVSYANKKLKCCGGNINIVSMRRARNGAIESTASVYTKQGKRYLYSHPLVLPFG